jgi:hypothetical protein
VNSRTSLFLIWSNVSTISVFCNSCCALRVSVLILSLFLIIGRYLFFSSLGLSLGEDNSQRHQDTGTQCKEAVFLVLRFSLRQKMGGSYINEGAGGKRQQSAQEWFVNFTDVWVRYKHTQRGGQRSGQQCEQQGNSCKTMPVAVNTPVKILTVKVME